VKLCTLVTRFIGQLKGHMFTEAAVSTLHTDSIHLVWWFFFVAVHRSRRSVDRGKKTDKDTAIETYDNVPLDNSSTSSQNGFVSIITSNHFCLIYSHNFSFNGKDIDGDQCGSYVHK